MIEILTATPECIAAMIGGLPEFTLKNTSADIVERVAGKENSIFVARVGGADAGFVVCYEDNDGAYYNWLMGVLPTYRRTGVGRAMMKHFAESALSVNLNLLRVKSMNRYPSMLQLLVDTGFYIVGVTDGKITFESDAQQVARRAL